MGATVCPLRSPTELWKEEASTKFWTSETWGTQTRRRDHKGCPALCGRLRRTHSRGEAGHLKLQTSCRDGPAKKKEEGVHMPDIRKSIRLKTSPLRASTGSA